MSTSNINVQQRPVNAGRSWKVTDDDALIKILATGTSINDIAEQLNRTPGAIRARQRRIARQLFYGNKRTVEEIVNIVRLSTTEVEAAIERSNRRAPPSTSVSSTEESLLSVAIEIRNILRSMHSHNHGGTY